MKRALATAAAIGAAFGAGLAMRTSSVARPADVSPGARRSDAVFVAPIRTAAGTSTPPPSPIAPAPERVVVLPPYAPPSLGSSGANGESEVIDFHAPFASETEREAWEEPRRRRWRERLEAENRVAIELMREKLGITDAQAREAKRTLDDELAAREELIAGLREGRIARAEMRARVVAHTSKASVALRAILTDAQWEGYRKLDPRQRALELEAHSPR